MLRMSDPAEADQTFPLHADLKDRVLYGLEPARLGLVLLVALLVAALMHGSLPLGVRLPTVALLLVAAVGFAWSRPMGRPLEGWIGSVAGFVRRNFQLNLDPLVLAVPGAVSGALPLPGVPPMSSKPGGAVPRMAPFRLVGIYPAQSGAGASSLAREAVASLARWGWRDPGGVGHEVQVGLLTIRDPGPDGGRSSCLGWQGRTHPAAVDRATEPRLELCDSSQLATTVAALRVGGCDTAFVDLSDPFELGCPLNLDHLVLVCLSGSWCFEDLLLVLERLRTGGSELGGVSLVWNRHQAGDPLPEVVRQLSAVVIPDEPRLALASRSGGVLAEDPWSGAGAFGSAIGRILRAALWS